MANSIALATQYLPLLDEVYKRASLTAILDSTEGKVRFAGGNKVKIFKTSMQGLGNYSRNSGFVNGDVTATWEEHELTQDRGRSFSVDSMDNEETVGMAFGTLSSEFLRTQVVPEVDAYRFSVMAADAGITQTAADITVGTTDVPGTIDAMSAKMDDAEVPKEGRILFLSGSAYEGMKAKISRSVSNEATSINKEILDYDGMRVVVVPQVRFSTAITLKDGTTSGQEAGGYVPTKTSGYGINALIVHPSAVISAVKHEVPRIFDPNTNQKADAWLFQYRLYYDLFVEDNKKNGIALWAKSTAIS